MGSEWVSRSVTPVSTLHPSRRAEAPSKRAARPGLNSRRYAGQRPGALCPAGEPPHPHLPSSRMPGSEPGTVPAGMRGTPPPPRCCLLCWFYTERFQKHKLVRRCLWRPSPFTNHRFNWSALHAQALEVTPSAEVGSPGAGTEGNRARRLVPRGGSG